MSAPLKYGMKIGMIKSPVQGDRGWFAAGSHATTSTGFVGRCNGLKSYVFDYGAPNHPELYQKSKEALLDYIRAEYDEGDAVALINLFYCSKYDMSK